MMEEFIDFLQTVSLLTMLAGTSYSQTAFLQVHSAVGVKVLTSNGALVMKQN